MIQLILLNISNQLKVQIEDDEKIILSGVIQVMRIDSHPSQTGEISRVFSIKRIADHFIPNPFPNVTGDWHPDQITKLYSLA